MRDTLDIHKLQQVINVYIEPKLLLKLTIFWKQCKKIDCVLFKSKQVYVGCSKD